MMSNREKFVNPWGKGPLTTPAGGWGFVFDTITLGIARAKWTFAKQEGLQRPLRQGLTAFF